MDRDQEERALGSVCQDARLALLAYRSGNEGNYPWGVNLEDRLFPLGYKLEAILDRGGVQGFVAMEANGEHVALVFRGTDKGSIGDIAADMRGRMTPVELNGTDCCAKAHRGFEEMHREIWEEVDRAVVGYEHLPHVVIGHSLGGALASLAACHLCGERQVARLTTFGGPMVGNFCFSVLVGRSCWEVFRVVRGCDKVARLWIPQVLLSFLLNGARYHHPIGENVRQVFIDSEQNLHINPRRWFRVSNQMSMYCRSWFRWWSEMASDVLDLKLPRLWNFFHLFRFQDHSMKGYKDACDRS